MSCKGSQMHCDVKGLVERSDHISEHRPTESQCKISLHSVFSNEGGNYTWRWGSKHCLWRWELRPSSSWCRPSSARRVTPDWCTEEGNQTQVDPKPPTFASQNLISVIGPGFSPLLRSSAESLLNTSSVCDENWQSFVFFLVLDVVYIWWNNPLSTNTW